MAHHLDALLDEREALLLASRREPLGLFHLLTLARLLPLLRRHLRRTLVECVLHELRHLHPHLCMQ